MILYIVRHGETEWNKMGKMQGKTDISLSEDGRKLENILSAAPKDVETAISNFPVSAISMGNMKLQACISDDHQFVATQLLAFKDFGYKPVTEMKTYTGKTAEAFAQLF